MSKIMIGEELKKYTLENYEEFCKEALIMPPFEDDEQLEEWFENHKVHIIANGCDMELEYNADAVNEIEYALREMYEVEMDIKSATTGNTIGSQYRPAELKDVLHVVMQHDWEEWGWKMKSFKAFICECCNRYGSPNAVLEAYYNVVFDDIRYYTDAFKCNFGQLEMWSFRVINSQVIKNTILELISTDMELLVGYDDEHKCSDITFIMDYTFKNSGELIGWFYGEQNPDYISSLIENYKKKLFEEEN